MCKAVGEKRRVAYKQGFSDIGSLPKDNSTKFVSIPIPAGMEPDRLLLAESVVREGWDEDAVQASWIQANNGMNLLKYNTVKLVICRISAGMDPVRALPSALEEGWKTKVENNHSAYFLEQQLMAEYKLLTDAQTCCGCKHADLRWNCPG